jgi:predicted RNase H-like HicB family nuclease
MRRSLDYYKGLNYKMVFEYDKDDKVYFVTFPELPGDLSHGKTAKEALNMALKVKDEWLEVAYDAGYDIPEPEYLR